MAKRKGGLINESGKQTTTKMAFHSDPPTSTGTVKWYNGNWPAESKAATVEEARELLDKLYKNGGNTCPVCDKEGLSKNHYTDGCRMNGNSTLLCLPSGLKLLK